MASAKKCDRCGKLYEQFGIESGGFIVSKYMRHVNNIPIDVCEECFVKLQTFMTSEDPETSVELAKWEYWDGWVGNCGQRIDDATCSRCGYKYPKTVLHGPENLPNYCANCGRKMKKQ